MDSPLRRLRPKKEFGQHFLVAPHAIRSIVAETLASPAQRLLEIGPGPGVLTEPLLESGRPLWAAELDAEACALLEERFGPDPNFHLLAGDAVQVSFPEGGPWAVVGNLPYNAATAILTRFLLEPIPWERMVFMFQLEVGQKLMGTPGEKQYGPLSVLAQLTAKMTRLLKLGPGAFSPPPKVDSIVLRFDPRPDGMAIHQRGAFLAFLHAAFVHRRKTLVNNLRGRLTAEEGRAMLQAHDLSPDIRAEALAPAVLLDLFGRIQGLH